MSDDPDDDPNERTFYLVRRYQAGDAAARDELFERYQDRVRRIVRVELGTRLRDEHETEDLLQATFGEALRAFDRFEMREPASLVRWLAKIARNQIYRAAERMNAAKRDAGPRVPLRTMGEESRVDGIDPVDPATGPVTQAWRMELSEIVDDCVSRLRPDWREVLLLREYHGGSWEWVAEQLGRSVHATQQLHLRAREGLRSELKRVGVDS